MKPPILIVKKLESGVQERDKVLSWILSALECNQENMKVIYDLLPERTKVKGNPMIPNGQTVTIDKHGASTSGTTGTVNVDVTKYY